MESHPVLGNRIAKSRLLAGLAGLILLLTTSAQAGAKLDTADPLGFFTNLASRLLQSELNLSLTRIQIYPTNQYTPAAHRLLQVTVNLYDATTNRYNADYPHLPSVFRPIFQRQGSDVFIVGYTNMESVTGTSDPQFSKPLDLAYPSDLASLPDGIPSLVNVYGVPWIIGAKKGLPNFNEFALQTVFEVTRKLQVTRSAASASQDIRPPQDPTARTNVLFLMAISSTLGVEAWNSYATTFSREVDIIVAPELSMMLTNSYGYQLSLPPNMVLPIITNIPAGAWPAQNNNNSFSFLVPFLTNIAVLPTQAYRFPPLAAGFTTNWDTAWDQSQTFPQPQWVLLVTNRLRFIMVDKATQRVVDYVQLNSLAGMTNLTEVFRDPNAATGYDGLWSTNLLSSFLPAGILNQISVGMGLFGVNASDWNRSSKTLFNQGTQFEIDLFRALYHLSPWSQLKNTNTVIQVPFTPTKKFYQYLTWQANDPLVHYMAGNLAHVGDAWQRLIPPTTNMLPLSDLGIGRLNDRYQPWGGNPQSSTTDPNEFNLTLKDPLVRSSDDWNFPDSEPLSLAMLGRVHRGTPWQTVYLKSAGVPWPTWQNWTGNAPPNDAVLTMPTNDWRLAALLVSLLNTNDPHHLLSVNAVDTNAWLGVLGGLSILTNSSSDAQLSMFPSMVQFDTLVMVSNSPQAAFIADAIQGARASQSNQHYLRAGDVLSVAALSDASPWLNQSSSVQVQRGITDEAYEKIPSQLLSQLRPDSVGSITQTGGIFHVQFSGFDDYSYAIEATSNFMDWTAVSTNYPSNGLFNFFESPALDCNHRFYRSSLLP